MKITVTTKVQPMRMSDPPEEAEGEFFVELRIPDAAMCLDFVHKTIKPALEEITKKFNKDIEEKLKEAADARANSHSSDTSGE